MNKIFSHSILTKRLRPSATDRLLTCTAFCCDIFFFAAEAVYRGSCDFFDTADVKKLSDFLLRNNILLISSDKYFETVFLSGEVLHGISMHLLRESGDF